jgi:Tfp pilus assembly protein PilO
MRRLHFMVVGAAESLGWPGILGLGLLAFIAAFYFSAFRPEELRVEELLRQASKLEDMRSRNASEEPKSPGEQLNAFYGLLPPSNHIADLLAKIYGAAERQSLKLEQGEYRAVADNVSKLTHYQVMLPVKGTYPQVRKFVASALTEVPNLSLESIQFERQKVSDTIVDAKIKMVLYLGRRS